MSKRPHSALGDVSPSPGASKRSRPEDPDEHGQPAEEVLANIAAANEALERLESSLKSMDQADPSYSQTKRRVTEMSRKYLPIYKRLAYGNDDGDSHAANHESPAQNKNHNITPPALIPSVSLAPWTCSEIPRELPPLPVIKNPELERQAFQHPGTSGGENYTRLEWLGDAYLELIATAIIFSTFPTTSSGRCSQLREQLIRNTTLADYFRQYGLTSKAVLPADVVGNGQPGRGRSSDKDIIKTQGDMFEAYVAAVILSDPDDGLSNCAKWLRALWSRTIKDQIIKAERVARGGAPSNPTQETRPGARAPTPKEELAKLIVVKGVRLEYKDMPGKEKKDRNLKLELFTVGVYLTGWGEDNKLLGWASALSKKEAGQKAAARALESKKQMKVYAAKKQAFLEARNMAEQGATAAEDTGSAMET
ncbi:Ribonuclease-like protein [Hapsidospora chrysogenum ATCC 11550]|uniref:Ribonuclease-like protein n=1 Tax=Hapsidospora chrysogenum (strain ATCC 11550 / CBS 779.69 / DSM 880 / IAM 14645 / JCM 23072 / IMI 49137) TaxID=857340 RepID=A0A086SWZ1_HAPC1|nr:Ribonuclease-like protein [Hapsidospora chrysogenum ATCC 11550]